MIRTKEYEKEEKVIFLKVNIDDCDEVAKINGIYDVPTFLYMKNKLKLRKSMDSYKLKKLVENFL